MYQKVSWQPSSSPPVNQSAFLTFLFVFKHSLASVMGFFPRSFKFQMDSLYISWQLSRFRKKRAPDKESVQGEEESGVPSEGRQNGKHFLFFLFLFSPALFPLTPGLNPELLKKPPQFRALSLEWSVIMSALLQWRVCAYTG